MPSNLDLDALFQQPSDEESVFARIERCEKTIRVIRRSVLMRLALTALLIYIPITSRIPGGALVLIVLVALINLSGLLPLVSQWRIKKKELDTLLDEE